MKRQTEQIGKERIHDLGNGSLLCPQVNLDSRNFENKVVVHQNFLGRNSQGNHKSGLCLISCREWSGNFARRDEGGK